MCIFNQIRIQHISHAFRKIKQVVYITYAGDIYFMKSLTHVCISYLLIKILAIKIIAKLTV